MVSSTFGTKKGQAFNPKNTIPTGERDGPDGCRIMLLGCFAASVTGALHKVDGILRKEYLEILQVNSKQTARKLNLGRHWTFLNDKDPNFKPTTTLVAE
jgi:hypothetical protein